MSSLNVGPLALSLQTFIVFAGVIVAWIVAAILGRQRRVPAADALFSLVLVSLVGARLLFVAKYWSSFASAPLSVIDIRDAGFDAWGAVFAAALWLVWRLRNDAPLRMPLLVAVASGAGLWAATTGVLTMAEQKGREMPSIALRVPQHSGMQSPAMLALLNDTLGISQTQARDPNNAVEIDLRNVAEGSGTIVNIWATWCPPCRREMPVLEKAQNEHAGLRFVFVNQGEGEGRVRTFVQGEGLSLDHVYLDPHGRLSAAMGAHGLPTTLFYNAQGELVDVRMGELSSATLQRSIKLIQSP